jgi:lia operon protein LiaF
LRSNRSVLIAGFVLVLGGAVLLAGNLFNFNAWALLFPVALIALGVWFVARPVTSLPGGVSTNRFIGDYRRSGPWRAANEEISQFVGDIVLDLSQAEIAPGETQLRINGFVGDVTLLVPAGVGVDLGVTSFVSEVNFFSQHHDAIFAPADFTTPGYAAAERRLRVKCNYFVTDIHIRLC